MFVEFEGSGDGAGGLADPAGIDAGANGLDDPGSLISILCRKDGDFEVLAIAEHDVSAIEAKSFDAETNFARSGFRKGDFVKLEDFGGTGLVEADNLYGVGHTYP